MSLVTDVTLMRGDFTLRVNTTFEAGSVVAVLGPNGAGKSTFLRALAGLERIDAGSIVMDGVVVDSDSGSYTPPQQRSVGVVFQDYALFPHLSVLENVAFGPRARGNGKVQARSQAHAALGRLGIESLATRKPREISGGQMQRVALARALATNPAVLLLDEPLAALDAETRENVRLELEQQLAGFTGCAVIVTHDPLDALLLADRVLVLENGHVVQDGTPAAIAQRPLTPYVAALVGVNLVRGEAHDGQLDIDGGGVLHLADHELSGRAIVVVRPEAVTIHRQQPEGSARNTWQGSVASLQPLQDRVRVHVVGTPSLVATVTPSAVADLKLARGTSVWLSVKAVELDSYPTPAH